VIQAERLQDVALLTIDRPERRNAINTEACVALKAAVDEARAEGARAIVITGAGGHFCAGADLSGVEGADFRASLRVLLDTLTTVPLPVMAAVQGAALGAGTQLAVACDLRMASPDARFGIPAAKLGLMVDHWTVQRLSRVAGYSAAQAMLLAAEEIDGTAAVRLGLAQRAGSLADALAWAGQVAELAPLTIAGHKLALHRLEGPPDDPDVDAALQRAWASKDLVEGMAAFKERRLPRFEGR
jgi:enoyl-CoA hydratase